MILTLKNLALAAMASVLLGVFIFSVAFADTTSVNAALTPSEEVPAASSTVSGSLSLNYDTLEGNGSNMMYSLSASGSDITMAHLHCAPKGVNGPIVVTLFMAGTSSPVVSHGVLSSGSINDSNVKSVDCESKIGFNIYDTEDLAKAIENGQIYANIHTVQFPAGAARGQLLTTGTSTDEEGAGGPTDGTSTESTSTQSEAAFEQIRMLIQQIFKLIEELSFGGFRSLR